MEAVASFKLETVLEQVTLFPGGMYSSAFGFFMNEDKWNKLPKQDQEAIEKLSGEYIARLAGNSWDEADAKGMEALKKSGVKIVQANPAFVAEVKKRSAPIVDDWITKATAKGVDAGRILKEFHVGLNVWSRLVEATFPYFDRTVAPFDSLWLPDHVQYNGHKVAEGWTLLTWALARYPDKKCGHEVLCNSFRNPAHLAKMVATAQALSGGRAILGIGAGWNEEEYRAYGWPYPSTRVRIAQLAESIQLIRLMWAEGPADYFGE